VESSESDLGPPAPGVVDRGRTLASKVEMQMAVLPRRRGRPPRRYSQEQVNEMLRLYFLEKLSMRQVANIMGVSHMSVYRMLNDPSLELLI